MAVAQVTTKDKNNFNIYRCILGGKTLEFIELNARTRENRGKSAARKLRKNNAIPAIVYGGKTKPIMLSLETIEFDRIIRENGTTGLFFLNLILMAI